MTHLCYSRRERVSIRNVMSPRDKSLPAWLYDQLRHNGIARPPQGCRAGDWHRIRRVQVVTGNRPCRTLPITNSYRGCLVPVVRRTGETYPHTDKSYNISVCCLNARSVKNSFNCRLHHDARLWHHVYYRDVARHWYWCQLYWWYGAQWVRISSRST